jgi:Zn-finger nucleic acid-binding protein
MSGQLESEINALLNKSGAIGDEMALRLKSADDHEAAARAERLAYGKLKLDREELNRLIHNKKLLLAAELQQQASQAAAANAEQSAKEVAETSERLKAKEAELDELIAKAKAVATTAAVVVEQAEPGKA